MTQMQPVVHAGIATLVFYASEGSSKTVWLTQLWASDRQRKTAATIKSLQPLGKSFAVQEAVDRLLFGPLELQAGILVLGSRWDQNPLVGTQRLHRTPEGTFVGGFHQDCITIGSEVSCEFDRRFA